MKVTKVCSVCVAVASVLCVAHSYGHHEKAVLNAKQLGIEDLDLDLDLGEDLVVEDVLVEDVPVTEDIVAEVPVVEEIAVEAPVVEEIVAEVPVVEEIAVEAPVVEEVVAEVPVVEEIAVEAPVVEEVVAEVPVVEEIAVEAPVVEEVVAEAPAPLSGLDSTISDILSDTDFVEPTPEVETVATVDVAPAVEEVAEVPLVEEVAVTPAVDVVEAEAVEVPVATPSSAEDIAISELNSLETARRRLFDQHGRDCQAQGQAALLMGNWDKSIEKYKESLQFIGEKESTIAVRKEIEAGLAEAFYRKSLELRTMNNFEEAEKVARESRRYGHPKAEELVVQIQFERENPPPPPAPKHEKRWNQPEYQKSVADIKMRMKIAKEYYATDELAKCRAEVEMILHDYPWYEDAVNMLRKISIAEHKYVENERTSAREQMIKDVTKAWASRTYGRDYSNSDSTPDVGAIGGGDVLTNTTEMKILEKMRSITIPELNFREANITDVVTALSEASREFDDQDIPAEERGVNIVLNLGEGSMPAATTEASSADPWATTAETTVASSGSVPPLTINVRYITLLSVLDLIMDAANLKYRIRDNVVMIMEANRPDSELIHRMYNVLPTISERVATIGKSGGDSGGGFGAFEGTGIPTGEVTGETDWKKFFGDLGVSWPDGSTCQYMSSIGKLVVKNTSRDLAVLESVLAVLNVTPKQVEIEVRFVEVMQSDLDSLGFEWTLNDDWEMAEHKDDAGLPYASRRRINMGAGSITRGFNYLSNNSSTSINDGSPVADNIATFTSILTNPELSVVLHMLSSKQNTDLLSAPKVVAQAGFTATIKVVTEYIYPTEYDVEMLESSSGDDDNSSTTYAGAVVEPQNFVMREVGVILEVTPEVTPDGSMINLSLTPSVVSEPQWKNYGSTYPVYPPANPLTGIVTGEPEYVQIPMEQPFFPVRSLATSVQIYNGATVVMGGMIMEERYTNEDKIPFLGDIPILGALFRNKYELSEKRNLLLFVTARLVDPAGREVKEAAANAILPTAPMN